MDTDEEADDAAEFIVAVAEGDGLEGLVGAGGGCGDGWDCGDSAVI